MQDFKNSLENILIQNYTNLSQSFECDNFIFWVLENVNILKKVMLEFKGSPENKEDRDNFEARFENKMITQGFSQMVNKYKMCLNSQTQPSKLVEYLDELLVPNEDIYRYSDFFRYSIKPSWKLMNRAFGLIKKTDDLTLLNYYTKYYEEFSDLEFLWPIVSFSKEMINECSFQYSRAQSLVITIKELLENKEYLRVSFQNFIKAWNSLKIELRFGCKTFNKIQITEDTVIGYLLVDTDNNSLGIILSACIQTLCQIQNQVIFSYSSISNQSVKNLKLSTISKDDIFYIESEQLDDIVNRNSINSFEYGKGEEIIYNFKQISIDIQSYIETSKLLDIDDLETVQYQFELLHAKSKYVGVISDIRSHITQVDLSKNDIQMIEREIKIKSDYLNIDILDIWDQAYYWLGKAILHIRYSKLKSENKIENYNEIILRVNHDFKIPAIVSRFIVGQIIDIYELVEAKIFETVLKSIDQRYKLLFKDKMMAEQKLSQFRDIICEKYSIEMFNECRKVFKRIIIRLLTANTNPENTIFCYFELDTYWNFKFLDKAAIVAEEFPKELTLDQAIEVSNFFDLISINLVD